MVAVWIAAILACSVLLQSQAAVFTQEGDTVGYTYEQSGDGSTWNISFQNHWDRGSRFDPLMYFTGPAGQVILSCNVGGAKPELGLNLNWVTMNFNLYPNEGEGLTLAGGSFAELPALPAFSVFGENADWTGTLTYSSEQVTGPGGLLSWQGSGEVIFTRVPEAVATLPLFALSLLALGGIRRRATRRTLKS